MALRVRPTALPGVLLVEPEVHEDARGTFTELFHARTYAQAGIPCTFVQDNCSRSRTGVVRGLHYQLDHPQAKLICAVRGEVFDVAVDVRRGSPTFGQWTGARLCGDARTQLFVPAGFAHGFAVVRGPAEVLYKCTGFYAPDDDRGVLWSDPELGIDWPVDAPIVSDKDARLPPLARVPAQDLPAYEP